VTTPKGEARREALVVAAAGLVAACGPDAVSHRSVATAAGLPLAATTYYFRDLADLVVAGVERSSSAEVAAAEAVVAAAGHGRRGVAETAALVVDVLLGSGRRTDADLQAHYERLLAGGRHPEARPVLRATVARLDALVADLLASGRHREVPAAVVVAVVDGTVLSALVERHGRARAAAEAAVADLLSRRRRW
jgi:DNA-binding transcriptional regulator YbjK